MPTRKVPEAPYLCGSEHKTDLVGSMLASTTCVQMYEIIKKKSYVLTSLAFYSALILMDSAVIKR